LWMHWSTSFGPALPILTSLTRLEGIDLALDSPLFQGLTQLRHVGYTHYRASQLPALSNLERLALSGPYTATDFGEVVRFSQSLRSLKLASNSAAIRSLSALEQLPLLRSLLLQNGTASSEDILSGLTQITSLKIQTVGGFSETSFLTLSKLRTLALLK